ncbi:hypothetical protein WDU94_015540 [Cyamophila willieti]
MMNKESTYCNRLKFDLPVFSHFWTNYSLRTPKKMVWANGSCVCVCVCAQDFSRTVRARDLKIGMQVINL